MPVDSKHPTYANYQGQWQRIRDVLEGTDAVKAQGAAYLPRPQGHTAEDYTSYVERAEFYPATGRTLAGLSGAIFRKEPLVDADDAADDILQSFTSRGLELSNFAKSVVREVLSMGRYGALVDVPVLADESDEGGEPFASGYNTENIINWRVVIHNRTPTLSRVVLREFTWEQHPDDEYEVVQIERYRVLSLLLEEGQAEPVYRQQLFQKVEGPQKDEFVQLLDTFPKRRGMRLNFIPFTFFGPSDLTPDIEKSPLLDLVDTNLSHYRTSAELEEGAYFTGLPMYVVSGKPSGSSETPAEFTVGSRSALMLEENGKAEVLTVSGEGMGLLKELSEAKERRMAVLGARILEDQKKAAEAAATVAMRHRGENSTLASLSDTTSRGLTDVLKAMIWWSLGGDDPESIDASVQLNADFTSAPMTPREMVELAAAWQQGVLGAETVFIALKDGERIPDSWDKETWLRDLEEGSPMGVELFPTEEEAEDG